VCGPGRIPSFFFFFPPFFLSTPFRFLRFKGITGYPVRVSFPPASSGTRPTNVDFFFFSFPLFRPWCPAKGMRQRIQRARTGGDRARPRVGGAGDLSFFFFSPLPSPSLMFKKLGRPRDGSGFVFQGPCACTRWIFPLLLNQRVTWGVGKGLVRREGFKGILWINKHERESGFPFFPPFPGVSLLLFGPQVVRAGDPTVLLFPPLQEG